MAPGTDWNQLESAWNRLEPTGSDQYLWGTVKYWQLLQLVQQYWESLSGKSV